MAEDKITLQLGDVEITALIPVAIKASETLRENPRVKDEVAVDIVRHLNMDTSKFDKFLSHEGVIARTIMLDKMVKDFVDKNPECAIVNIAAGLDNRFSRVDNGKILWFDLDLPDMIDARKKVFEDKARVKMLPANALDEAWAAEVKKSIPNPATKMLFLAEGLFMYLSFEEIAQLLTILKTHFPCSTLIAEQNSKAMVKHQKHHDTVSKTNAVFRSGSKNGQEIAALVDGVTCVEEHSFNEEMRKYSLRGKLFAMLLPGMNDRWAVFEW